MTRKSIKLLACGSLLTAIVGLAVHQSLAGGFGDLIGKATGNSKIGDLAEGAAKGAQTLAKSASLGEKDEENFGRSTAYTITSQYPLSTDKKLQTYVNYVGHTLVDVSAKPNSHWIFGVLDSDTANAFSGPNGYIFLTRGAVQSAQNEAQLAGLLAHEITHVLKQHGLNAVRSAMTKQGFSEVGQGALKAFGKEEAYGLADATGDLVLRNGYDKPQEFEADTGGVQLIATAGYDPNAFLAYLKHLEQLQKSGGGQIMSTHPGVADRIKTVQKAIAGLGAKGKGGAILETRFKNAVAKSE